METNTPEKLEPAASIIDRFGGPEAVQAITGADRTRVYRWTQPKGKGGTDGLIPFKHVPALIAAGRERGVQLSADDFLPQPEQAGAA